MGLFGIILLSLVSLPSDWQKQARFEDDKNFYYVGVSSPTSNEMQARKEAYHSALSQLMVEHFGQSISMQENSFHDLKEAHINQELQFESQRVRLRGLILKEIKWSRNDVLYMLLAYKKTELKIEKKRQENLPPTLIHAPKNNETYRNGSADLKVYSEPSGAFVYLDGDLIGKTPLLAADLEEGPRKLTIAQSLYESFEQEIVLAPGSETKIERKLKKMTGSLILDLVPDDALITVVNNPRYHKTSLRYFTLEAGDHKLIIEHPDYYERTEDVFVSPDRKITRMLQLAPKPSKISILSNHYPVDFDLLDREQNSETYRVDNTEPVTVTPGEYDFLATAKNFPRIEEHIILKPNGLKSMQLVFTEEAQDSNAKYTGKAHANRAEQERVVKNIIVWGIVAVAAGALIYWGVQEYKKEQREEKCFWDPNCNYGSSSSGSGGLRF